MPAPAPDLAAAMEYLGFCLTETGGGCTAWESVTSDVPGEHSAILITVPPEPRAPLSLGEPCVVSIHTEHEAPEDGDTFATVAGALLDLYGLSEGDEYPDVLAPLAEAVCFECQGRGTVESYRDGGRTAARVECPRCSGDGGYDGSFAPRCPECKGAGCDVCDNGYEA